MMATDTPKPGGDRFRFGPFEAVTFYGDDEEGVWSPYLRKWGIHIPFAGSLWLHHFIRGDADRDLHDHPWDFWTLPLVHYVEEVGLPDGRGGFQLHQQVVARGRVHYRPASYAHRVIGPWSGRFEEAFPLEALFGMVTPITRAGSIWTLVFHRPKSRAWGFLKNREGVWCWQGWRAYHHEGGKSAPCETEKE
jgi:hypothetical protein